MSYLTVTHSIYTLPNLTLTHPPPTSYTPLTKFSWGRHQILQQNLIISLGVIAFLILISVLGVVQLGFAVILHEGSTLVVVGNALRLLAYRPKT